MRQFLGKILGRWDFTPVHLGNGDTLEVTIKLDAGEFRDGDTVVLEAEANGDAIAQAVRVHRPSDNEIINNDHGYFPDEADQYDFWR
jgi:hypothetical protein